MTIEDKEKGGTKDSIDAKTLKPQKDKCSLIPIYLEYKEAVKVTSTYGENFLKQVNPVSHRIHTNYSQIGADTTRITSGGKDKYNRIEYVNLLNLPADAETRACFVAEKGNKWISIDYSGQETYLMASIAMIKQLLKSLPMVVVIFTRSLLIWLILKFLGILLSLALRSSFITLDRKLKALSLLLIMEGMLTPYQRIKVYLLKKQRVFTIII